jgi:hypothetical protein
MMGAVASFLRRVRALAGRCAIVLAVSQVVTMASATILAALPSSSTASVSAHEECTCDHAAGVMCPMHRRSSSPNGPRWCAAGDASIYFLLPGLNAPALPVRVAGLAPPTFESVAPALSVGVPLALASPPDSPPPRA